MNDVAGVARGVLAQGIAAQGIVGQPGQALYLLTMATGLALAMLVGLQIALALYARRCIVAAAGPRGGRGDDRPPAARRAAAERALDARRAHRLLGRVVLVLVIVHPLFYLSAVTQRIGRFAPDKLAHAFTDGSYYGDSLLIGLAGVGVVAAFAGTALVRRRVPVWHGLVRVGVLLGGWHALRIGSHVQDGVAGWLLLAGLALVMVDGAWRVARWWLRRRTSNHPVQASGIRVRRPSPGLDEASL